METILSDTMKNAMPSSDSVQTIILIGAILVIVGGLIWIFWYLAQFKHLVRIRVITGSRSKIIDDKARQIIDHGVPKWQLLKRKAKIPLPPEKAIAINDKGNYVIDVMFDEESGEYHYLEDKVNKTKLTSEGYEPLTTNQREILISEIRRANDRRSKNWKDIIQGAIPIAAMLILVICLMVFYGDIAKPVLEMGQTQVEIAAKQEKMLTTIQEMIESKQIFVAGSNISTSKPPS